MKEDKDAQSTSMFVFFFYNFLINLYTSVIYLFFLRNFKNSDILIFFVNFKNFLYCKIIQITNKWNKKNSCVSQKIKILNLNLRNNPELPCHPKILRMIFFTKRFTIPKKTSLIPNQRTSSARNALSRVPITYKFMIMRFCNRKSFSGQTWQRFLLEDT
jgi:hypothetical protein